MRRTHVIVPFTDSQRPFLLLSEHSQHKVHTYMYTNIPTYVCMYLLTGGVCPLRIVHLIADIRITARASRVGMIFFTFTILHYVRMYVCTSLCQYIHTYVLRMHTCGLTIVSCTWTYTGSVLIREVPLIESVL